MDSFASFRGKAAVAVPEVEVRYLRAAQGLRLNITNSSQVACKLTLDNSVYANSDPITLTVAAGKRFERTLSLEDSHNWYDIMISMPGDPRFLRRFGGWLETGADGISDAAAASSRPNAA